MRLVELFDRKAEWHPAGGDALAQYYEFRAGNKAYRVRIDRPTPMMDLIGEFLDPDDLTRQQTDHVMNLVNEGRKFSYVEFSMYDSSSPYKSVQYGTQEVTGTGNEYLVFSTVLDIIKSYIGKSNADYLFFQAKEPSRIKLYDRLARMAGKEVLKLGTNDAEDFMTYLGYLVEV